MEFVPLVILATMVKALIDWFKSLIPDRFEAKVLMPIAWSVGVAVALLFSASPELAADITIWGEHRLASASIALVVVYGFAIGAGANVIHNLTRTDPRDRVFFDEEHP